MHSRHLEWPQTKSSVLEILSHKGLGLWPSPCLALWHWTIIGHSTNSRTNTYKASNQITPRLILFNQVQGTLSYVSACTWLDTINYGVISFTHHIIGLKHIMASGIIEQIIDIHGSEFIQILIIQYYMPLNLSSLITYSPNPLKLRLLCKVLL
jgi:hypothetical protein